MSTQKLKIYGCTDQGNVRPVNEDHILIGRYIKNSGYLKMECAVDDDFIETYGMLFAVADGIGGEKAGEIASNVTLTTIERHFYGFEKKDQQVETYSAAILAAAKRANDTLIQISEGHPEYSGLGTTISGICVAGLNYLVFNAGDSRVYRFRNGILKQLTDDDTLVNIAIKTGSMTREEAAVSDARHTITNSVGTSSFDLKINEGPPLREGDCVLICSDGVHDLVSIECMEEIISAGDVDQAANALLDKAKANGGHDNISLILVQCCPMNESDNADSTEKQFTFIADKAISQEIQPDDTEMNTGGHVK